MWIGLLLATIAPAQDVRVPINYTTPAISVSQALAQLSELSKIKLSVVGDISTEPLILRFKQVPLSEAMQRIADVVHAEWKPYGKGFLLERTPVLVQNLEKEATERRAQAFSDSVSRDLKEIAGRGPWTVDRSLQLAKDVKTIVQGADAESAQSNRLRDELTRRLPDFTALLQMLSAMNPRELAAIKPGERVAFSNMPGRMQRKLPQDIVSVAPLWR